jgi:hypothetical protein
MEIFAAIIPVLTPFAVTAITSLVKRSPVFDLSPEARTVSIRLVAAVFSFAAATFIFMLGGDPVSDVSINELVFAAMTFLGSVGGHHLFKK